MFRYSLLGLLAACLILPSWQSARGGPPTAPAKGQRTDRYGDPLPPGALARMGSARLRVDAGIEALAFWPDDATIAACCTDGSVRLWDRATGMQKRRLRTLMSRIDSAAFLPDGKTVALLDDDKQTLLLWDTAAATATAKIALPDRIVGYQLAVSPDGKLLAVSAAKGVHLYEAKSGRKLRSLDAFNNGVWAAAFSPDSSLLVIAPLNPPAQLWDVRKRKKIRDLASPDSLSNVGRLAFSRDGRLVAVGNSDCIVISEVATGKERARISCKFNLTGTFVFAPDGRTIVTGNEDSALHFWNSATGKERLLQRMHPDQIRPWPVLSKDGKSLAVGVSRWDQYRVVNLLDGTSGKRQIAPKGHEVAVRLVAFSSDGRTLLTGGSESVRSWEATTGKLRWRRHGSASSYTVLSPDRKRLTQPSLEGVDLWDLSSGKRIRKLKSKGPEALRALAFTPDGRYLLSVHNKISLGGSEKKYQGHDGLRLWDLSTGKETRAFATSTPNLYAGLVITPDSRTAIAGSFNGSVERLFDGWIIAIDPEGSAGQLHVWDLRTGREFRTLHGHRGTIEALSLSADGRLLVSGSADKTFRLWEPASGQTIFTLPGYGADVQAAALSPDGRLLATNSGPSRSGLSRPMPTIYLWSVASGKPVLQLRGHGTGVRSLAFALDGRRLASGLEDGTALVWDVTAAARAVEPRPQRLGPAMLDALWTDLAATDAATAHRALWALVAGGDAAGRMLKEQLKPAAGMTATGLQQLLAGLDAKRFTAREASARKLADLGNLAEPALRAALSKKPSLEMRRRIEKVLTRIEKRDLRPEQLREMRSVAVLERLATPQAREILKTLTKGASDARLTREAEAALRRLAR